MLISFQFETSDTREIANISAFLQSLVDSEVKADESPSTKPAPEPTADTRSAAQEQEPEVVETVSEINLHNLPEDEKPVLISEGVEPGGQEPTANAEEDGAKDDTADNQPEDLREAAKLIARALIIGKRHLEVQAIMKKHKIQSVTVAPDNIIPEVYADLKELEA